jgi:hypothetical protein
MRNLLSGKMPDFVINVIASIVFAILLWAGGWLATLQGSDEASLQYRIYPIRVGPVSVWHVRMQNTTKYAFDLVIRLPRSGIIRTSFSLPSPPPPPQPTATVPATTVPNYYFWQGTLHVGKPLEVLIVADDPQLSLSGERLSEVIRVSYEDRDPKTGSITRREATLQEASGISISNTIMQFVWLCLPFVGFGLILWGILGLRQGKAGAAPAAGQGTQT